MGSITDGTSNTIAIAETDGAGHGGGAIRTSASGVRRSGSNRVYRVAFVGLPRAGWGANESGQNTVRADGSGQQSGTWFRSGPHTFTPSYLAAWGPNAEWNGPSSFHTGGVQTVFCDGSVAFLSEGVDMGAWLKLNAIADGNTINSDPRN